jgi:hypothetical protein
MAMTFSWQTTAQAPANAAPLGVSKTKSTQAGKVRPGNRENFVFQPAGIEDYSKNLESAISKQMDADPAGRSADGIAS